MAPASGFTGREWVLDGVASWLAASQGRHFLLTGEPGSGKSAIARHLAAISAGTEPGQGSLTAGVLAAAHFCSARDGVSIDPRAFSHHLAGQVAAAVPPFGEALKAAAAADRNLSISVVQNVGQAGSVVGVQVALSGADVQQTFNRLVAEPLQAIYAAGYSAPLTILVDGLDEALVVDGTGIVRLLARTAGLPSQVRFVVTSRRDARVIGELGVAENLFLSAPDHAARNRDDLARYATSRIESDESLGRVLAKGAGPRAADFARRVAEVADGNFQYAVFLLAEIAAGKRDVRALDGLPAGLDGLYLESLNRVVGTGAWPSAYRPVMGVLSVAREPLTDAQLAAFSGLEEGAMLDAVRDLQQFIDESEEAGVLAYRLYHQSVVDFLQARRVGPARTPNPYLVVPAEAHAAVAKACLASGQAWDAWDAYALRHAPAHLAGAADRPRGEVDAAMLVDLVLDPGYQAEYVARFDDPVGLETELERAVPSAARAAPPLGVALVLDAALGMRRFAATHLRPEPLFELARAGKLEAAERRLASFRADAAWRGATLLALAWSAARAAPQEARASLDRSREAPLPFPLEVLRARIEAEIDGGPPWLPAPLPGAPGPAQVFAILERLGGGNPVSGIEPLSVESGISGDEVPAYLAEMDGPLLVAYAVQDPVEGGTAFRRYLAIHAGNAYAYYRNRSLWALLEPVLRHPDPAWAMASIEAILVAALSPSDRTAFGEATPIAVTAARARTGADPAALGRFREQATAARLAAAQADPIRGGGDPWAHHLRRIGALAEVHDRLLDDRAGAQALVDQLATLRFGFAGFRYRACLEAADAAYLTGCRDATLAGLVEEARGAAHNIQDFAFCARATARVNALEALGWPGCAVAESFLGDPGAPTFAPRHRVGEAYAARAQGQTKLEIPVWARQAATPGALAELYRVSAEDVLAANPGNAWAADAPLAPGTEVVVPDPAFVPMAAARLAAGVLGEAGAVSARCVRTLMALVHLALPDAQALDTVLARLVIAARPTGPELDRIEAAVAKLPRDAP